MQNFQYVFLSKMWDFDINNHELAVVKETLGSHKLLETFRLLMVWELPGIASVLEKVIVDKNMVGLKIFIVTS